MHCFVKTLHLTLIFFIFQYFLETFTEERTSKWDHEPFRGIFYSLKNNR